MFAATPADLAAASDLVCLCVVNDADVEQVVDDLLPAMAAGSVIAVQSTVRPETCIASGGGRRERDVTLIDAPVSGGAPRPTPASSSSWWVVTPRRSSGASPCSRRTGTPSSTSVRSDRDSWRKLVNNVLFIAHLGVANDAYVLGESLGLERSALYTIVSRGSGNSYGLGIMSGRSLPEMGALAGSLLRKDVDIVAEVAAERGADAGRLIDVANDAVERMEIPDGSDGP